MHIHRPQPRILSFSCPLLMGPCVLGLGMSLLVNQHGEEALVSQMMSWVWEVLGCLRPHCCSQVRILLSVWPALYRRGLLRPQGSWTDGALSTRTRQVPDSHSLLQGEVAGSHIGTAVCLPRNSSGELASRPDCRVAHRRCQQQPASRGQSGS